MKSIVFPLNFGMRSATVTDLQDGLALLLDRGVLRVSDAERLRTERAEAFYAEVTLQLVQLFMDSGPRNIKRQRRSAYLGRA
ncbi:MAG: hypothetical protein M3P51_02345 [Chloroflexota bacterium]|nr:hypothetical protein [Chloroflexota bacterium]